MKIIQILFLFLLLRTVRLENEDLQAQVEQDSWILKIDNTLKTLESDTDRAEESIWAKIETYSDTSELVNNVQIYINFCSNKLVNDLTEIVGSNFSTDSCGLISEFKTYSEPILNDVTYCMNEVNSGVADLLVVSDSVSQTVKALQFCRKNILSCSGEDDVSPCIQKVGKDVDNIISKIPEIITNFDEIKKKVTEIPKRIDACNSKNPLAKIHDLYLQIISTFLVCIFNDGNPNIFFKNKDAYGKLKSEFPGTSLPASTNVIDAIINPLGMVTEDEDLDLTPRIAEASDQTTAINAISTPEATTPNIVSQNNTTQ